MIKLKSMPLSLIVAAFIFITTAAGISQSGYAAGNDDYGTAPSGSPTVREAEKALKKEDYAAAYAILEAGVGSDPDNADIHNLLGFSARKMGRYDESMRHYKKALALDPKHKGALEYMGELHLTLDQPEEARALLERLDDICWLGCSEERDLKRAIEAWEEANS